MKRSVYVTALIVITLTLGATTFSCNSDGPVWIGPDYPAGGVPQGEWVNNHALALTDDGRLGIVLLNTSGESLVLMTVLDADRKIADVEGAVWMNSAGDSFVVRFDDNGWPNHAVVGTDTIFFGNWDLTTVDIAVLHANGTYEIYDDLDRSLATLDFPLSKPGQPLELIKFDGESRDIVLEELPTLGVRNPSSEYYLSPFGRALQAYQYSAGFSIVQPRPFSDASNPQNWLVWALAGTELGACALKDYAPANTLGLPCGTDFVENATTALMNPDLKPFYLTVTTPVDFGTASPMSDAYDVYQEAEYASHFAEAMFNKTVMEMADVAAWAPFFISSHPW